MNSGAASPPPSWSWHYRMLSRLRDTLVRERDQHTAEFRVPIPRGGEDASDIATEQIEHQELLAHWRAEEAELSEIEAALARIRNGTYGVCQATGEAIAPARLRAIPWTRFSHRAATELEKRPATHA